MPRKKRFRFEVSEGDPCPYCKIGTVVVRLGKYGQFYACNKYPSCGFAQPIESEDLKVDDQANEFLKKHGIDIPVN